MLRAGAVALVLSVASFAAPIVASGQTPPTKPDTGDGSGSGSDEAGAGAGSEVELGDEPPAIGDTGDEDENPHIGVKQEGPVQVAPKMRAGNYPITEVLRPLTLPDFTSEIRLEALMFPSPIDAEFALRARYGITRQIQLGLQYGIGGFYNDGVRDKVRFNTGKAVALDLSYLAADWIAPRLTVPMYVDPFAIGFQLGAPVKFRFGDRFAIVGFEDVVGFKVQSDDGFVPDLRDERNNETAVRAIQDSHTIQDNGYVRLDAGVLYQLAPDLVVSGRFGLTFPDFSGDDAPSSLRGIIQFTPIRTVDLVGEAGWDRLDEPRRSLHLSAALAVRI